MFLDDPQFLGIVHDVADLVAQEDLQILHAAVGVASIDDVLRGQVAARIVFKM